MNRAQRFLDKCFTGHLVVSLLLHGVLICVLFQQAESRRPQRAGTPLSVSFNIDGGAGSRPEKTVEPAFSAPSIEGPVNSKVILSKPKPAASPSRTSTTVPIVKTAINRKLPAVAKTVPEPAPVVAPIFPAPLPVVTQNHSVDSDNHEAAGSQSMPSVTKNALSAKSGSGGVNYASFDAFDGPRVASMPSLRYPPRAKRLRKEGRVLLLLDLDDVGTLGKASILESAGYGFDEAALKAILQARFFPAERNGRQVACRASLPIAFRLQASR